MNESLLLVRMRVSVGSKDTAADKRQKKVLCFMFLSFQPLHIRENVGLRNVGSLLENFEKRCSYRSNSELGCRC